MWTNEQSLELVNLYRNEPLMWDPTDPEYFERNRKNDVWRYIARLLEREVDDCKQKMLSLLASYRREKAKVKNSQSTGKGTKKIYTSCWFAYESFSFLSDRNTSRKGRNTEITTNAAEEAVEESNSSEFVAPTLPSPKSERSSENSSLGMLSEVLQVLKHVASTPEIQTKPNNIDSGTQHFSNFICSKMQNYDKPTKIAVQRAIMDIIFRADECLKDVPQNRNISFGTYGAGAFRYGHTAPCSATPFHSSLPNPSSPFIAVPYYIPPGSINTLPPTPPRHGRVQNPKNYVTATTSSPISSESSCHEKSDSIDDINNI